MIAAMAVTVVLGRVWPHPSLLLILAMFFPASRVAQLRRDVFARAASEVIFPNTPVFMEGQDIDWYVASAGAHIG